MDRMKKDWNYWGENDPYYAVSTIDKFRKENLTETNKDDFFQSGYDHVRKIWNEIEENFVKNFKPRKALDFGCGVGRLVIPLAERCEKVAGVDISDSMLDEAQRNCRKRNVGNVKFLQTNEFLASSEKDFDFQHTFIALQHVNPEDGEEIVEKMIASLAVDGIGVLHLTYDNPKNTQAFWRYKIYRDYPLVNRLKNLLKGGKNEPILPLYLYDLNKIFSLLQAGDCHKCLVRFTFHGMNGVLIIFQKKERLDY